MEMHVLVIEDEVDIRKNIAETLQYEGMQVSLAHNGLQGIKLACERLPDIIICDINMPDKDGYAVLEALQSEAVTANIPFIFLTAMADRASQRRGMTLGADDFLTKPFTSRELLNAIQTRLEKITQRSQAYEQQTKALRDSLIQTIPHELRTPLVGIINGAEILVKHQQDLETEQTLEISQMILRSGQRLHRLIEHYLLFAQLEIIQYDPQRIQTLRQVHTDAPNLQVQHVAMQIATMKERQDDLEINLSDDERIQISSDNLIKVIEELIDNACKFSQRAEKITLSTAVQDHHYIVQIIDQGRGMSIEQLKKIDAFMQFGRELYEQQGAGLGLVIAKRLIELHGGQFDIQSKINDGTRIQLAIPIKRQ